MSLQDCSCRTGDHPNEIQVTSGTFPRNKQLSGQQLSLGLAFWLSTSSEFRGNILKPGVKLSRKSCFNSGTL